MDDHFRRYPNSKCKEGNALYNKPKALIDHLTDEDGNLFYLVAFKPSPDKYYRPQWVWWPVAEVYYPNLLGSKTLNATNSRRLE